MREFFTGCVACGGEVCWYCGQVGHNFVHFRQGGRYSSVTAVFKGTYPAGSDVPPVALYFTLRYFEILLMGIYILLIELHSRRFFCIVLDGSGKCKFNRKVFVVVKYALWDLLTRYI
jgi:hypothetical protein